MSKATPPRPAMAEMESLVFNPSVFAPGHAQPAASGPAEPESHDVPFSSIRFLPGLAIQVSLAENPQQRHSVKLIGLVEGKSILITALMNGNAVLPLREGQKLLLRTFFGNSVYIFSALILRCPLTPYPYIHLTYPGFAREKQVRRATRVSTSIIATVDNLASPANQGQPCRIADLSINGAMLAAKRPFAAQGDPLNINFRVKLDEIDEYVSIAAQVRSVTPPDEANGETRYGVSFAPLDSATRLLVENYIYRQLVNE